MNKASNVGVFGKLPAHGDFIYRHLSTSFINSWDSWLQGFVGSSQQQLGDSWLDVYLTSPIWRFVLSSGVVDGQAWTGIVLPSVDRVGRYFPFSIAMPMPAVSNPFLVIEQHTWYDAIEQLALSALSGQLQLEDLVHEINEISLITHQPTQRFASPAEKAGIQFEFIDEVFNPGSASAHLLDSQCREIYSSYSVWATAMGSERIAPCILHTQGLPNFRNVAALLDGQWSHWGWYQPVQVQS